jgi:hypothetical protein
MFTVEHYDAEPDPVLYLTNADARQVFDLLGLPIDDPLNGVADPDDFTGRILVARSLLDVATTDAIGRPSITEGRIHHGGRPPGYYATVLDALQTLAATAAAQHTRVFWS